MKRRLVLENDDLRFSAADVLWIRERTGVRPIFDYQHFWCLDPERLDMRQSLERFLATWPTGVRPAMHFSSPRTELREIKQKITPKQREAAKAAKAGEARVSRELLKAPVKATVRVKQGDRLKPPLRLPGPRSAARSGLFRTPVLKSVERSESLKLAEASAGDRGQARTRAIAFKRLP